MWNHKNDKYKLIYKTEIGAQTQKMNVWLPRGRGRRDKLNLGLTDTHYYI